MGKVISTLRINLDANIAQFRTNIEAASKHFEKFSKNIRKTSFKAKRLGEDLTRGISIPLGLMGGAALKSAVDFDKAFTGIKKTVDSTPEGFAKIKQGILNMSEATGIAATELSSIGEVVGQMGTKDKDLLPLVKTVAMLRATTNLAREEAAFAVSNIASAFDIDSSNIERVGSTIVALGNSFKATESEISNFATRFSPIASSFKLTAADMLGFSTAVVNTRINVEAGASALQTFFLNIKKASSEGGDSLAKFANVANVDLKEFTRLAAEDMPGAATALIEGLGGIAKSGGDVVGALDALGIKEKRLITTSLALANNSGQVAEALKTAREEYAKNTALTEEFATRQASLAQQFNIIKTSITRVAIQLGEILAPIILKASEHLSKLITAFSNLDPVTKKIGVNVGLFLVSIGPVLKVVGALGVLLTGPFAAAILGTALAIGGLTAAWATWGEDFKRGLSILEQNGVKAFDNFNKGLDVISKTFSETTDAIIDFSKKLYQGIKTWLVDKFESTIVRPIKSKIESVTGYFEDMYIAVVGNSFVPDMVKETGQWFDRLDGLMVRPTEDATEAVSESFADLEANTSKSLSAIGEDASSIGSILGNLEVGGGSGGQLSTNNNSLNNILSAIEGGQSGRELSVSIGKEIGSTAGQALGTAIAGPIGGEIGSRLGEEVGKDLAEFGKNQRDTLQAIGLVLGGFGGKLIGDGIATLLSSEDADETARKQLSGFFNKQIELLGGLKLNNGIGGSFELDNFDFGYFAENGGILPDGREWVEAFWQDFGEAGAGTFSAVGVALNEVLGVEGNLGSQIAFALSENLGTDSLSSNLDNIKLFLDTIGVSTEELTNSIFEMAKAGEISFHEFEVFRQGLAQIPEEGLAAAGDYKRAMELVLESGGKGQKALLSLQNLAVEAGEAGVHSLEGLKAGLLQAGFSAEEVDALFYGFSERGIKSIEDLKNATEQQLGGIIADMQSAGIEWSKYAENVADTAGQFNESADSANKAAMQVERFNSELAEIPSSITTDILVNYRQSGSDVSQIDLPAVSEFATGGVFKGAQMFGFNQGRSVGVLGERGAEAVLPLTEVGGGLGVKADLGNLSKSSNQSNVYNIDARGAIPGSEARILNALKSIETRAAQTALKAVSTARARGY